MLNRPPVLERRWVFIAAVLAPSVAAAQIFVVPERANKGRVRNFDFDWRIADIDPVPDEGGGLRLYFYDREQHVAEWAAASVERSYAELAHDFGYVPKTRFPYILYSAYQEFLSTNLFPLQEGVLGVTSPIDLTLTLPYFGDHRLFQRVSKHELAHQFTIQKLRDVAEARRTVTPLNALPLWFIEGLAEFYAQGGLDDEAKMYLRDRVLYPDDDYRLFDFFEDRPWDVGWTYKIGQARVAFLEETYGPGTVQRLLERAPSLTEAYSPSSGTPPGGFGELVAGHTGERPRQISAKFEDWVRDGAYAAFLAARQEATALEIVDGAPDSIQTFAASPGGQLIVVRDTDPLTGISRLRMFDHRYPAAAVQLAADGGPGVESLHPVAGRTFAVGGDAVWYAALSGGTDLLYRQAYASSPDGEIELGKRRDFDPAEASIIAVFSPAVSPDGESVAFVGMRTDGVRDVYVLTPLEGDAFALQQLTRDNWAERDLAWGPEGVVFTSDATSHRQYNLFMVDPAQPEVVERLTADAEDQMDPVVLADGRVFFVAWHDGRADLHELTGGQIVRRSSASTGLFGPHQAPGGDLWAVWVRGGKRRLVRVHAQSLRPAGARPAVTVNGPQAIPKRPLTDVEEYSAARPSNWRLANVFGVLGAGDGLYGQLFATAGDQLRNHLLVLSMTAFGRFELTDGFLLYINQRGWSTWGTGAFQSVQLRLDRTFEALEDRFVSFERFYGALGLIRWPFNTFQYVEAELAAGAVDYFLRSGSRAFLRDGVGNGTGQDLLDEWNEVNDGPRLQTRGTLRLGHDTVRYHAATGPFDGTSLLLELVGAAQPQERETFGHVRVDAVRYLAVGRAANFFVRGALGFSEGGRVARQFYLSSFDTLRGVPFGDVDFLVGSSFAYATAELQLPLTPVGDAVFFPVIEAVLAVDAGSVGSSLSELEDRRVADVVVGGNLILGVLQLRAHFAKPLDVGAPAGRPNGGDWVTNLSLTWIYY